MDPTNNNKKDQVAFFTGINSVSASTVTSTSNRRRQLKINLLQRHFNEATKIWHYMATVWHLYGNCIGNCIGNCMATV